MILNENNFLNHGFSCNEFIRKIIQIHNIHCVVSIAMIEIIFDLADAVIKIN